jgi:hypothetical protein
MPCKDLIDAAVLCCAVLCYVVQLPQYYKTATRTETPTTPSYPSLSSDPRGYPLFVIHIDCHRPLLPATSPLHLNAPQCTRAHPPLPQTMCLRIAKVKSNRRICVT